MNPDLDKNLVRLRKISKDLMRNTLTATDREWLSNALSKIYEGINANTALEIDAGRGQRREITHQNHEVDIALHIVACLHDESELGGGRTLDDSFQIVARCFQLTPDTLKRYWNDSSKVKLHSRLRDHKTYD